MDRTDVLAVVKKARWNVQGFNAYPLLLLTAGNESAWRVGYSHIFYMFQNGRARMHYDEADWRAIGDQYYRRVSDIVQLQAIIDACEQEYQAHASQFVGHDNIQHADLARACDMAQKSIWQLIYSIGGASHAIEASTLVSEARLREILTKKNAFSEIVFSELCSPTEPSFLYVAQKELWNIKNAEGTRQSTLARDFLTRFAWVQNTFLGSARLTEKKVIEWASEIKEEVSASEFAAIAKEKERLMAELRFSEAERFVVETIDLCFSWQDDRKKHIFESVEAFSPILDRLVELTGIDAMSLQYALAEEFSAENFSSKAFKETLISRRKGSAYYCTPAETLVYNNSDYTYFVDELHVAIDESIKEFKGVVASRGVVQGIARVCESVSDIARVQTGEILVASMTRPEYLPAMQRAAAFVTDEGGITSHAAIVSLELKKPRIIGTRIATRLLNDGDMIEVDANAGVVRIISPITVDSLKTA